MREISRHFTRHAELSMEGEVVRVFRQGKPYVRIVPDEQSPGKEVPHVDFAARAKKDLAYAHHSPDHNVSRLPSSFSHRNAQ